MHDWGDETVDWAGIDAAAKFIATYLVRWGRVNVRDYKEKWGTVRVYLSLGWQGFHSITHPRHVYCRYPAWLWRLDCLYFRYLFIPINKLIVPYHVWLYRRAYQRAVRTWPHLRREILAGADFSELLKDLK